MADFREDIDIKGCGLTVNTDDFIVDANTSNVGIGKTPFKTLDVNGDTNIDGDLFKDGTKFIHTDRFGSTNLHPASGQLFIGDKAGLLSSGLSNTGIGRIALEDLGVGGNNVALGDSAGKNLTTAGDNTVIGALALSNATSANDNTAIGVQSLKSVTTGNKNIGIGRSSGDLGVSLTGDENIGIGYRSLYKVSGTSSKNIVLGSYSGSTDTSNYNHSLAIGWESTYTKSNQITFGGVGESNAYTDIVFGTDSEASNVRYNQVNFTLRAGKPNYDTLGGGTGYLLDNNANSLTIAGGESTGTGVGGDLIFNTTTSGVSGTSYNALAERLKIDGGDGKITFNNSYSFPLTLGASDDGKVMQYNDTSNAFEMVTAGGGSDGNGIYDTGTQAIASGQLANSTNPFNLHRATSGDSITFRRPSNSAINAFSLGTDGTHGELLFDTGFFNFGSVSSFPILKLSASASRVSVRDEMFIFDDTALTVVSHNFRPSTQDSYVNAQGGDFGVGMNAPTHTLTVGGDSRFDGRIRLIDSASTMVNDGTIRYTAANGFEGRHLGAWVAL